MDVPFRPVTQRWFQQSFSQATPIQAAGWPRIARGEHCLLVAPTGSGKTLAAFLWAIDRVSGASADAPPGVRVLYISPLKALAYDVERNLRAPLAGLKGLWQPTDGPFRDVSVDIRTGDTSAESRRRQLRHPADILVTTPESLYLMLGSQAAATLRTVNTVIVDEVHALAPSKRGTHLSLSLERLGTVAEQDPQRIGLSATVKPAERAAAYLGGDRPVQVVDCSGAPHLDLRVTVPVTDMAAPPPTPSTERGGSLLSDAYQRPDSPTETGSMWTTIAPRLLEDIRRHTSTIVFTNSRGLCERLAQQLNELAGEQVARAHHGSVSHENRRSIEESLKAGELPCIVATSSLELGIDMGVVELVLLVESPRSVSRGLQRIGRAGHHVGGTSRGTIYPKYRADLLEAAVITRQMQRGEIESLSVPQNPLDVLAQQIVAACSVAPQSTAALAGWIRRASPYRHLNHDALVAVLEMLSGQYASDCLADLRPRLSWDRQTDVLTARRGAKSIALLNGGAIPDRGLYTVHVGEDGPRIGELDEEMVHETRKGEVFLLGASSWRVDGITRDRVVVSPAPGEPGKMPFWRGDGPGRPIELGRALGRFVRELGQMPQRQATRYLCAATPLDEAAATNLVAYIAEQHAHTGTLPTDTDITVERFRDELGDWRICILTPFGARVHAPWAMALEHNLSDRLGAVVESLYTDDGIAVRLADSDEVPPVDWLLPEPESVYEAVVQQLPQGALFAAHFRENAGRSLLLPKRRPRARAPLWQQRLKARNLLAAVLGYDQFPVILETYRECLRDVFDMSALHEVLHGIQTRQIRVHTADTPAPSPFAQNLVFAYVATYLYEQDAPVAERRAQALTLNRELLESLLGETEVRTLLDPAIVDELEAELQGLSDERRARDADELEELLRRVGDLTAAELRARTTAAPESWLQVLAAQHRAHPLRLAGDERWVAATDIATYRDALGAPPPAGLPESLLKPVDAPLQRVFARYARSRGPFTAAELARRYSVPRATVDATLETLHRQGRLVRGALRPMGHGTAETEWCDAEILRRLKQRTLAKLRREIAPVEAAALADFLYRWHGLDKPGRGMGALREVVAQLEGAAVSWRTLVHQLLPARVEDFHLDMLDMLSATGQVTWIGVAPSGATDGWIMLLRREQAAALVPPAEAFQPRTEAEQHIVQHLQHRGASFAAELSAAAGLQDQQELESVLWDLVWAGQITNDTFQPLRTLERPRTRRQHRHGPNAPSMLAGRWTRVQDLFANASSPALAAPGAAFHPSLGSETNTTGHDAQTRRAHAHTHMLLQRYGVVSREAPQHEPLVRGFRDVYAVLQTMERAGRVRRGHFVTGLSGAQFAYPAAVEQLRAGANRRSVAPSGAQVLAAQDPANIYGALLPWPQRHDASLPTPKRKSGAWLIQHQGHPLAYLEANARSLHTFAHLHDNADTWPVLIDGLRHVAAAQRSNALYLEKIDGKPARQAPVAPTLLEAGFVADHKRLTLIPEAAPSPEASALPR